MAQKKQKSSISETYISIFLGIGIALLVGSVVFNATKQQFKKSSPATEPEAPTQKTHVVEKGETLWSIAQNYYESGYNWVDLQKANHITNPDQIEVGQSLIIPEVKQIVPKGEQISATTTDTAPAPKTHLVVRGENLWKIAVTEYNDGYKWTAIAKYNNLHNPSLIHAGNVLILP